MAHSQRLSNCIETNVRSTAQHTFLHCCSYYRVSSTSPRASQAAARPRFCSPTPIIATPFRKSEKQNEREISSENDAPLCALKLEHNPGADTTKRPSSSSRINLTAANTRSACACCGVREWVLLISTTLTHKREAVRFSRFIRWCKALRMGSARKHRRRIEMLFAERDEQLSTSVCVCVHFEVL